MPAGYETANGTFDVESRTVCINADYLKEAPDYEKAFYLFHELRHVSQYLCPELFSSAVNRSIQYVIMYATNWTIIAILIIVDEYSFTAIKLFLIFLCHTGTSQYSCSLKWVITIEQHEQYY